MKKTKCKHKQPFWYSKRPDRKNSYVGSSCNDDGWYCPDCNTPLGFRPDLDRGEIGVKVSCILHDFVDAGLICVSNGTEAECIIENVMRECEKTKRFDSYSILKFILDDQNIGADSHAEWYVKEAKGVREGKRTTRGGRAGLRLRTTPAKKGDD